MENIDNTIIVSIIAAIPTIVLIFAQSKQRKASINKDVGDVYSQLLTNLRTEVERLGEKIDFIEKENNRKVSLLEEETLEMERLVENLNTVLKEYVKVNGDLRKGVIILSSQVERLGETPEYVLPDELNFDIVENKEDGK